MVTRLFQQLGNPTQKTRRPSIIAELLTVRITDVLLSFCLLDSTRSSSYCPAVWVWNNREDSNKEHLMNRPSRKSGFRQISSGPVSFRVKYLSDFQIIFEKYLKGFYICLKASIKLFIPSVRAKYKSFFLRERAFMCYMSHLV